MQKALTLRSTVKIDRNKKINAYIYTLFMFTGFHMKEENI